MEILGVRPLWSMSDGEKLSALDAVMAERARLDTIGLQLVGDLEESGYAKEIGAGDTARLLSLRYRIDAAEARRDVRVATALTRHPAVAAALPDPATPFPDPATAHPTADNPGDAAAAGDAGDARTDPDAGAPAASTGWRVHPAQAEAIVSVLDKVPSTVPAEDVEFAERQLIDLAATHSPSQLRAAGKKICDILDPDGPEPDEKKASAREALTLRTADQGVTFRGYLANENAELFRTLIHAGAKPRKSLDGELDPRPHAKRQADALTTVLNTAATAHHMAGDPPARTATGSPDPTSPSGATTSTPAAATADAATNTATNTATAATNTATADAATNTADGGTMNASTARGSSTHACTEGGSTKTSATNASAAGGATTGTPMAGRGTGDPAAAAVPGTRPADSVAVQEPLPGTDSAAGTDEADAHRGGLEGGFVPGYGPRAQISVTIDFNDLKAAAGTATGELVFGDNLSAAAIRRLACDAEILPIVLGSKSQPLDVGTSQRLATRAIRRALNVRDRGCVVCGAPPIQCEAHHLAHWIDGGATAVSNLVLLCKRHHNDLHSGHWHIEILDGVVHVTRPTWADPDRIPHGRYRPPTIPIHQTPPGTAARFDPWSDGSETGARTSDEPPPTIGDAARFDPWGDGPAPAARIAAASPPTAGDGARLDPWGDDAVVGDGPRTPVADALRPNPWGDDSAVLSGGGARRVTTAATLDPWGDTGNVRP